MFTSEDLKVFAERGITVEQATKQMSRYETGFEWLDVLSAATPAKGIKVFSENDKKAAFNAFVSNSLKVTKFVPASGAASRMFKDLFNVLESGEMSEYGTNFTSRIKDFAFYTPEIFNGSTPMEIIDKVLNDSGLGYGSKPKGQLLFHRYSDDVRTAFEEHLVEGALYAKMKDGTISIVISVSPEHLEGFKELSDSVKEKYEKRYGVKYSITFTLQSPSTDTIAATEENKPFRKEDGSLLFRPGGHGALIKNLNEIDSDIVVIKNIDNVVKEDFIEQTVMWKKLLIGKLIILRERCFNYIERLDNALKVGCKDDIVPLCNEVAAFLEDQFCITLPKTTPYELLPLLLRSKLDRPIRVCGMVRNLGEPGGGPFIVRDADGCTSLQILESVELNPSDPRTAGLFAAGTHFNPVDLVCSITGADGNRYDLSRFVNNDAGFISSKSYEGRKLKALELPGLWNGAMSNWNTTFVEVPLITFNPVKTVSDLLRKEHLG
ncbi:MAG TPA: DUF4301 family protein [Bacteroidales bacterium]|nr:DUF4301 family protein [Bacteroidales bacterium]